MKNYKARLERLLAEAAECELIGGLATNPPSVMPSGGWLPRQQIAELESIIAAQPLDEAPSSLRAAAHVGQP